MHSSTSASMRETVSGNPRIAHTAANKHAHLFTHDRSALPCMLAKRNDVKTNKDQSSILRMVSRVHQRLLDVQSASTNRSVHRYCTYRRIINHRSTCSSITRLTILLNYPTKMQLILDNFVLPLLVKINKRISHFGFPSALKYVGVIQINRSSNDGNSYFFGKNVRFNLKLEGKL